MNQRVWFQAVRRDAFIIPISKFTERSVFIKCNIPLNFVFPNVSILPRKFFRLACRDIFRRVISRCFLDLLSFRYFVEEMQMEGFNMVRCIQGAKTFSLPMQMLGADLQAHRVIYNNNPVLKWCLTNTGIQTDRNGNIVPVKNQSPKQRIDGTAALLDSYVGLYEHFGEFTSAIE